MFQNISADLRSHCGNWGVQGFWALVVYRFGRRRCVVRSVHLCKALSLIYRMAYKLVQFVFGIELPCEVELGRKFVIDHSAGIVICGCTKISGNGLSHNPVVIRYAPDKMMPADVPAVVKFLVLSA